MTPLLVNGRPLRVGLLVSLVAAVLVLAPASSMAKSATKTCGVRNVTLGKSYGTSAGTGLQAAIDAARPGDTIEVRGRCVGNFSIGTSLTLLSRATSSYPMATLDGGRTGTVVNATRADATVPAPDVTLDGLLITNGSAGGVANIAGIVRVIRSSISGNATEGNGGGISAGVGGTVTLTDSGVSGNTAVNGGGIAAGFGVAVTLSGSSVSGNTATANGGGIYNGGGTVSLLNSRVSGNTASPTPGSGGGIYNDTSLSVGIITLDAASGVSGNSPDDCVGCIAI